MTEQARWNSRRAREAIRRDRSESATDIAAAAGLATHSDDPLAEPIKVAGFWRNRLRQEEIRVTLARYEGRPIVDVRVFFTTKTGHMQASKKGVAVAIAKLPELRKALEKAEKLALDLDLIEAVS